MPLFNFADHEALGSVSSVDTNTVIVEVGDIELLRRLQVNRLAVLQSSKPGQHLIGLITQVTRKKIPVESTENDLDPVTELNLCKIVLIGTMSDRIGAQENVFRRTLESVPEIDANCFSLEGDNLTGFMRVISHAANIENALIIGKYTLDDNAIAYLNGNKLFQRHAFIGGSTGSGKSWTTARIIEQVAELRNANAIIFDIHGEYAPLISNGISHFKIAGPGDIEAGRGLNEGIVHLPYWLLSYEALVSFFVDRSDQNAPNQSMIMAREVNNAKQLYLEQRKESELLKNFTIDSPVPFRLEDILSSLNQINTETVQGSRGDKQGEFFGKLSRMISRLENKISDRRLGFLFQGGDETLEFSWLHKLSAALFGSSEEKNGGGVKIIDSLKSLPTFFH